MPKSIFKYPEDYYFPTPELGFELYGGEKEARKELRRLRDIAHKREQRLKATGFEKSQTYKELKQLANLRSQQIKSADELALWLAKLETTLKKEETTVKGAREKRKKRSKEIKDTLTSHGYDIDDLDDFGDFMEEFRAYYGRRIIPSDQAAELYETLEGLEFSADEIMMHYDDYVRNLTETKRIVQEYKAENPEMPLSEYFLERLREL